MLKLHPEPSSLPPLQNKTLICKPVLESTSIIPFNLGKKLWPESFGYQPEAKSLICRKRYIKTSWKLTAVMRGKHGREEVALPLEEK